MSVKSLIVTCDWCGDSREVNFEFPVLELEESVTPESWLHLEADGDERDYCSKDCLIADL